MFSQVFVCPQGRGAGGPVWTGHIWGWEGGGGVQVVSGGGEENGVHTVHRGGGTLPFTGQLGLVWGGEGREGVGYPN